MLSKIIYAYTYIRIHVLKNGLLLMYICNKTTIIYIYVLILFPHCSQEISILGNAAIQYALISTYL